MTFRDQEMAIAEVRYEYLKSLVEEAKQNPLLDEEYQHNQSEREALTKLFLNGSIDGEEYDRRGQALEMDHQSGLIQIDSIDDLTTVLRLLGFSDQAAQEMALHEWDHYMVARQKFSDIRFGVKVVRGSNGRLSAQPAIICETNVGLSDDERRQALRAAISAPEELSPSDQEKLGSPTNGKDGNVVG